VFFPTGASVSLVPEIIGLRKTKDEEIKKELLQKKI
jgi:hypothetical protein